MIKQADPPKSETAKARPRLSRFCIGNGIDIGYGGDPIVPTAITMDMPERYTNVGDVPQNLSGNARSLYWFNWNVLDYVYSSHLLEDFSEEEIPAVLEEWFRVLKPGGFFVLYGPDQPAYEDYCNAHGTTPNPGHKIRNFGLKYIKEVFEKHFSGRYELVHEVELTDDYCFDFVVRKLRN